MEIARREASKRGFPPDTKRVVHIVTDGDNDLARHIAEIFPKAIHTIDVMHVIEKLGDAGSSVHREGSRERRAWVEARKRRAPFFEGEAARLVRAHVGAPLLTTSDVARLVRASAPVGEVLDVSSGDLATRSTELASLVTGPSHEAVLVPITDADVITFDVFGHPAWSPMAIVDGAPCLALDGWIARRA